MIILNSLFFSILFFFEIANFFKFVFSILSLSLVTKSLCIIYIQYIYIVHATIENINFIIFKLYVTIVYEVIVKYTFLMFLIETEQIYFFIWWYLYLRLLMIYI